MDLIRNILETIRLFALQLSHNSFPPPLSAQEERLCFDAITSGDAAARDRLIRHNLRLVAHIMKKYYTHPNDQDDLLSIGTIGLIKAVDTFNYHKGVRFATYAARCINNEILMQFRAVRKAQNTVFINDALDIDSDGNSLTLLDVISDDSDISEEFEHRYNLVQVRNVAESVLQGMEKDVISMRYGLVSDMPMTQHEVAAQLGISRSYVSRIEKKALEEIRKNFD